MKDSNAVTFFDMKTLLSSQLREKMSFLASSKSAFFLKDIFWDRDSEDGEGLIYYLYNLDTLKDDYWRVSLKSGHLIPSIVDIFPSASWPEIELYQQGILFEGRDIGLERSTPFKRASVLWDHKSDSYSYADQVPGELPIGVKFELLGEEIERLKIDSGYLSRNIQNLVRKSRTSTARVYIERLNQFASETPVSLFNMCLEGMIGLDPSDRVKALRMVFWELDRINEHTYYLLRLSETLRGNPFYSALLKECTHLSLLKETLVGNHLVGSLSYLGGVKRDISISFLSDCMTILDSLVKTVEKIDRVFSADIKFCNIMKEFATPGRKLLDQGVSGPALRASGFNFDLRKKRPYYFYADVDFEVPVGINGTAYDRYLILLEEIRQSRKIIGQLLNNLPTSEIHTPSTDLKLISKRNFCSIESARGMLGIFINASSPDKIDDFHISTPSSFLIHAMEKNLGGKPVFKFYNSF